MVQSFVRMAIVRRRYAHACDERALRQHEAALRIQAFVRGTVCALCQRARALRILTYSVTTYPQATRRRFLAMCAAVLVLQSTARGHLTRQMLARRVAATVVVQSAWRAHAANKTFVLSYPGLPTRAYYSHAPLFHRYGAQLHAITCFQAHARAHLLRSQLRAEASAAVCIQAAYKSHATRVRYLEKRCAALRIQCVVRGWRARVMCSRLVSE